MDPMVVGRPYAPEMFTLQYHSDQFPLMVSFNWKLTADSEADVLFNCLPRSAEHRTYPLQIPGFGGGRTLMLGQCSQRRVFY